MDERKADSLEPRNWAGRGFVLGTAAGVVAGMVIWAASFLVAPVGKVAVGNSEYFGQVLVAALYGVLPGLAVGSVGGLAAGLILEAVNGGRRQGR
jgi:hypothetical protein